MTSGRQICNTIRPLQISHYAIQTVQLTHSLPGIYIWGVPGIPSLFLYDDILIYSRNQAKYLQNVTQNIWESRNFENSAYTSNLRNASSSVTIVHFHFHVINQHRIHMDQKKIQAAENWPQPTTIMELQCFLGFTFFYRRFNSNFNNICSPLTSLLKHGAKSLFWNTEASNTFNQLKKALCVAPIEMHPNPELHRSHIVSAPGWAFQTPFMCLLI